MMEGGRDEPYRILGEAGLVCEPQAEGGVLVRGSTYPWRRLIRQAGGHWLRERAAWRLPDEASLRRLAAALRKSAEVPGLAERPVPYAAEARPHYHGHRARLRQRLLEASPKALADYELLELLLFFSIHRRDTKPIAKAMLEQFGGLGGVLAADPARYREVFGLDPEVWSEDHPRRKVQEDDLLFTQVLLKAVKELLERVLRERVRERPVIGSWSALLEYLQIAMAHEPREQFRILFLDRKNVLIKDEVQSSGTVDHTPLYPREVVRRALELGASAIIMVHNHPSGDPTPSEADIAMTQQVVRALQAVGIVVHDHVIVARNRHTSFRSLNLL